MKQLNALTFVHEDIVRYTMEAADALDSVETLIGNTNDIETYSQESSLTLSEKEALHLVALTKTPADLLRKKDEKEEGFADKYSEQVAKLISRAKSSMDSAAHAIQMLQEISETTNEEQLRNAVNALDLSVLPEGVEADLSFKTVSELHKFHFETLGSFIDKAKEAATKAEGLYIGYDYQTVSLLGQYTISTEGYFTMGGCFIVEMDAPVICTNSTTQESTKALLADIVAQPLPAKGYDLMRLLQAVQENLDGLSDLLDNPEALENEVSTTAHFAMRTLSAIRSWAFIYGTVYNTLVKIS